MQDPDQIEDHPVDEPAATEPDGQQPGADCVDQADAGSADADRSRPLDLPDGWLPA
jgi:hypothetical protein